MFGETKVPMVAVSTFDVKGDVSTDEAEIVTELFITELVSKGAINIVDRANFDKILAEMKFQESDWSNKDKTAELEKATNATAVIRGKLMKIGSSTIYMTATLIDINTAQIISSAREDVYSIEKIYDILPQFCEKIASKIPAPKQPERILGKWRAMVYTSLPEHYHFGPSTTDYFGPQSCYKCSFHETVPIGDIQIEFKEDGTFIIPKFNYYELEQDFLENPKVYKTGDCICKIISKTEKGSGFWQFTDVSGDKYYRYYKLQINTDSKKNMTLDLVANKSFTDLESYGTKYLAIPDAYKWRDFSYDRSKKGKEIYDYVVHKKNEQTLEYLYVELRNWIKVNNFEEEGAIKK